MIRRGRPAGGATRDGERGQSLVEFSMIVPLFLLFLLGLLEFGMVFDHVLTISYATREGARTGAALANGSKMADESLGTCSDVDSYVVAAVERVLDSPGSPVHGDLSQREPDPDLQGDSDRDRGRPRQRLDPGRRAHGRRHGSSTSCARRTGWDSCTRNNNTSNPDSLGVSISYTYHAVTPLASLMRFFGGTWLDPAPRDGSLRHGAEPDQLEGL